MPRPTESNQDRDHIVIIPFAELASDTLQQLIQEFVSRDGCDWDETGCSLAEKVEQVMQQLRSGRVQIVFDLNTETTNLIATTCN